MNAKEYLSQAMYIDQRINSKLEQVTRLRENVTNCTATLSDMPRPDSPNKQRMEETICKIVDLEREINADIDRLNERLAALSAEKGACYLDLASAFKDENGAMPADFTPDGIHLNSAQYITWFDYLKTHTLVEE